MARSTNDDSRDLLLKPAHRKAALTERRTSHKGPCRPRRSSSRLLDTPSGERRFLCLRSSGRVTSKPAVICQNKRGWAEKNRRIWIVDETRRSEPWVVRSRGAISNDPTSLTKVWDSRALDSLSDHS